MSDDLDNDIDDIIQVIGQQFSCHEKVSILVHNYFLRTLSQSVNERFFTQSFSTEHSSRLERGNNTSERHFGVFCHICD